jgi:DUF1365 family protein
VTKATGVAAGRTMPTTVAANGPAPEAAAMLYAGDVMHARMKPVGHRFQYRVFTLLVDIDRLDEAERTSPLFSVGRFNLLSFKLKDHGRRDGSALRPAVEAMLAAAGHPEPPRRILLLCYPRVLGYVFNPLSVYFCYGDDEALTAIVYEVRNTFGELHPYVAPVRAGEAGPEGLRQRRPKVFHVSPFIDMAQTYHFRLLPPGEAVRVRILETDAAGPTLAATFVGRARRFSTGSILAECGRVPLMTLKVIAAIHFEALRLWWKGVPLQAAPTTGAGPHVVAQRK